jgi:mRNA interferase HigB
LSTNILDFLVINSHNVNMWLVGADILIKAARKHPDAEPALRAWMRVVQDARWQNLAELRQTYPSADGVTAASGAVITVFNIRGNRYRLLTRVSYKAQTVQIVDLLTHSEYDKDKWKRRL